MQNYVKRWKREGRTINRTNICKDILRVKETMEILPNDSYSDAVLMFFSSQGDLGWYFFFFLIYKGNLRPEA